MKKRIIENNAVAGLMCLFLLLPWGLFPTGPSADSHSDSPYWWHVVITLEVSGHYRYRGEDNQKGIDGHYRFTSIILGNMQEDEQDYIFMQAYQEIKNLTWQETVFRPGVKRTFQLADKVKPDATLNYVFKEKDRVYMDLDFLPVPVPYNNQVLAGPVKQVKLPESAGVPSVGMRQKYNTGVYKGSNLLFVTEKQIYDSKFNDPRFAWSWKKTGKSWQSNHQVKMHVKIVRMEKEGK